MGHSIQAIVTRPNVANAIRVGDRYLPRVETPQEFCVIPVDTDFVDAVSEPTGNHETTDFMLLTAGFYQYLCDLSRFGPLAYIETHYHGGHGYQGAAVFAESANSLPPNCGPRGIINRALRQIGVRRAIFTDQFAALRLYKYRSNDDLLRDAIQFGSRSAEIFYRNRVVFTRSGLLRILVALFLRRHKSSNDGWLQHVAAHWTTNLTGRGGGMEELDLDELAESDSDRRRMIAVLEELRADVVAFDGDMPMSELNKNCPEGHEAVGANIPPESTLKLIDQLVEMLKTG